MLLIAKKHWGFKRTAGLSLLEVMIVLAILAALLMGGLFAYRSFFQKKQLITLVNSVVTGLRYARFSALSQHHSVSFCPCGAAGSCGFNWRNTLCVVDEVDHVTLRHFPLSFNGYRLSWKSSLDKEGALRFRSDGFTAGQQGSFLFCHYDGGDALSARIVILRTGRLRSEIGGIVGCGEKPG